MSESKIHVKVGIVEFSGEGDKDWLAEQLDKILEKIPELLKIEVTNQGSQINNGNGGGSGTGKISGLSVINIASKLNCKSGPDLIIAAAAYIHFIEKKPIFSRDDLSQAMRKATGYFRDSYISNLTPNLASLEKANALTQASNTYSLHINKVNELNAILSK
ncbi:MAG: hypothetical protein JNL40_01235 [Cyclobacteriaceae bacterium]|nr:hypothetical protein [Cyclobacteriaceae bacterium]